MHYILPYIQKKYTYKKPITAYNARIEQGVVNGSYQKACETAKK